VVVVSGRQLLCNMAWSAIVAMAEVSDDIALAF